MDKFKEIEDDFKIMVKDMLSGLPAGDKIDVIEELRDILQDLLNAEIPNL